MIGKKLLAMLGFLAFSSVLFAQSEKITIKASSRQGKNGEVVFLEADLAGRTVDLTCLEPHSDCKVLRSGEYEMLRLVRNEGTYNDCQNIDIYRTGADRTREKPLGEYCLLQP
jgi:hypothetical protein